MRLFCLFVALLGGAVSSLAQPIGAAHRSPDISQYVHRMWQRADGLPQDTVADLVQTRDGYLWLGTQEGLVRFDGLRFTLFNKANTPEFTHNEVDALAEGPDGSLWVGTFGGLLQLKDGRFRAYSAGGAREREAVVSLVVDSDGAVWAGTQNGGLNRFSGDRLEHFSVEHGLPSAAIEDLAIDRSGALWVATPAGLAVRREGRWRTFDQASGLPVAPVHRVMVASDGTVWVGSDRGIAWIRDGEVSVPAMPEGLAGATIRALFEDRAGGVWVGTDAGVVWRRADGTWTSRALAAGTPGNNVDSIAEDREGNIWLGTYLSGLHRLWRGRFLNLTTSHGLADGSLRAIVQTRDGDVWLTTEQAGISRVHDGSVTTFTTRQGLAHDTVRALLEDSRGTVWAGTRDGLSRFENGRFVTLPATAGLYIRALVEDAHGTIWLGAVRDGAMRLVDGRPVDVAEDGHTRLPKGIVRALVRDREGAIWIGTNDSLTRVHGSSVKVFTSRDGLPTDAIYCIHQDRDGTYWLGSYGGGLTRMRDGVITRFRQADGLFDDVVYQILEDDHGRLWLSSNNGVFSVDKQELDRFAKGEVSRVTSVAYDSSDGMLSSECNGNAQPAGWRAADGKLWFPTTKGAVIIDPANLGGNTLPPLVAIERVVANRVAYPTSGEAVVEPGAGQVEFDYTGLSFIAPRKVRFRYKLDGLDADWVDAGDRRQTSYANLAPGRYVFRVMASNNDAVWSEPGAEFAFVLRPRVYQTSWFRALMILLGLAAIAGGYRLRLWRHLQRERELKEKVDQAVSRIKVLGGLIPICAHCKKIRDDSGYWNHLESYLKSHSEATFSHGLCPECFETHYPDYVDRESPPGK